MLIRSQAFKILSRYYQLPLSQFSTQIEKYNPWEPANLAKNKWLIADPTHKKSLWTHKSQSEEFIHRVPVIEVETDIVRCLGGTDLNAGHPQIYIKLDTREEGKVQVCGYCGLRYKKKSHHHH